MVDLRRLLEPIERITGPTAPLRRLNHPLLPALAAAVLSQGLLVALLRPLLPPRAERPQAAPVDDTPELLRLGDRLNPLAGSGPSLGQPITLPPPPPPPPDLTDAAASLQPATRAATAATEVSPPAPPARATPSAKGGNMRGSISSRAKSSSAAPAAAAEPPNPPAAAAGLPRQPGVALELARAIAEGAASALPNDGVTQAMAGQQRRQVWLDPAQQRQLQRGWEQAEASAPLADWGELPDGTQVRRTSRSSLGTLADGDARARSLVSRLHITLLWPQGSQLWLLRLPLAGSASQASPG